MIFGDEVNHKFSLSKRPKDQNLKNKQVVNIEFLVLCQVQHDVV